MLWVQVQSLVGELRSHMPCGQKKQSIKQKLYCNKFSEDFKNDLQPKKEKEKILKKKKVQRIVPAHQGIYNLYWQKYLHVLHT